MPHTSGAFEPAAALTATLEAGELPDAGQLRARFVSPVTTQPEVHVALPTVASFDALLGGLAHAAVAHGNETVGEVVGEADDDGDAVALAPAGAAS